MYNEYQYNLSKGTKEPSFFKKNWLKLLISVSITTAIFLIINVLTDKPSTTKKTSCGENVCLELLGSEQMTIYQSNKYIEPGYVAETVSKGDITDSVKIDSNVDTSTPGIYEIEYKLVSNEGTKTVIRTITVLENDDEEEAELTLTLSGSTTINITTTDTYEEPGYQAIDSVDGDITSKVLINNQLDITTPGTYEIIYTVTNSSNITKQASRIIIVTKEETADPEEPEQPENPSTPTYNLSVSSSTNITIPTNSSVNITINVTGEGFKYILLPNSTTSTNPNTTYTVSKNGTYIFYVYDKNNQAKRVSTTVTNIDRTSPTAVCTGYIENNRTIVKTTANDENGISGYVYKSGSIITSKKTTSGYVFYSETKSAQVTVFDNVNNETTVSCAISDSSIENPPAPVNNELQIHVISVSLNPKYGDAIVIRDNNSVIVIDGGIEAQRTKVLNYLTNLGITKIDVLIGTHYHIDHIENQGAIINNFNVSKAYYISNVQTCVSDKLCKSAPTSELRKALTAKNIPTGILKSGDTLSVGGMNILITNPPSLYKTTDNPNANLNSINMLITFGTNKFYLTGDGYIESSVLKYQTQLSNIDYLKYPHHGIYTVSKNLIDIMKPKYTIVTSKENRFDDNSDRKKAKQNLLNVGTTIYQTYKDNNIVAISDGKNVTIRTNVSASDYKK